MPQSNWTVVAVPAAWDEIRALPPGLGARILRLLDLTAEFGVAELRAPHARQVEGKLWELRVKGAEGIARGLYVTQSEQRLVVLHVFVKNSQKTPARALALARQRMREIDG
jgi:phage-related protein